MATEGATKWECSKCTFINESEDASVCEMCGVGKRPAGKGKGRLRPRLPKPPEISTFADSLAQEAEGGSRSSGGGRSNNRSRSGRALRPAAIEEEEEGEEGEEGEEKPPARRTADAAAGCSRRSGTRSSARVKQLKQEENQLVPLVVDDSDQSGEDGGEPPCLASDHDDEDDSGETPLLLGRGWSAEQRDRAKQRKLDQEGGKVGKGGKGGSSTVGGRRGRKRQRPLPPRPGDDLFRDRTYPVGGDGDDDDGRGGGDALTLTLILPAVEGVGRRPFWRWPPPPSAAAICGQGGGDGGGDGAMSPGRREVGGGSTAASNGGLDPPVDGAGCSAAGGSGVDGEIGAEQFPVPVGCELLPTSTQEEHKKPKKK